MRGKGIPAEERERNNNINSLISGQIRGRPWASARFLLLKFHIIMKDVEDLKIMNPTEGKHKGLAEPREMRCAKEEDEPVTPQGVSAHYP